MLTHIDPRQLDKVWPTVAPLLSRAIEKNAGECDLSQLRAQIAYGGAQLLVWEGDGKTVVATVEFQQYPNYRTALLTYVGGEGADGALAELKPWADAHGASKIECWCGPAQARLFARWGFQETHRAMRIDL